MRSIPIVEQFAGKWRSPDRPVILVPGHHCFGITAQLPPGTLDNEREGIAVLAIEQASPFPIEHLATGFIASEQGDGLVATAVYRRKLAPEEIEAWKDAQAVIPDYAAFLCGGSGIKGAVVVLETPACVSALDFGPGGGVPQKIVSRAVATGSGHDAVAKAREQVLERVPPGGRPVFRYKLAEEPVQQRGTRLRFKWEPIGSAPSVICEMPERIAWAQDLRDSEESAARRKAVSRERFFLRTCMALVWILALLVLGEVLLAVGNAWIGRREADLAASAPAVAKIESDSEIANRLDAYGASKPVPLELLAYINDLRPKSIYFTRVSFEAPSQMTIDAATGNLDDVNNYVTTLKRAPGMALVETRKTNSREGGATFQLILAFEPGFDPSEGEAAPAEPADKGTTAPPEGVPIIQ